MTSTDLVPEPVPGKHSEAFRTISEVAADLAVPQHVLRFWESRFAQIKPTKRAGGRRYYRPDDVALLKGVRHLLHGQGYTIRGAQRVLRQKGTRFVQAIGRGEAQVDAPPPQEREGASLPTAPNRVALAAALEELLACRALLAGLASSEDATEG